MRWIVLTALLLGLAVTAAAETRISVQINTLPNTYPQPYYPYPQYAYPERSYYYYDGISQAGGGQIRTEQSHRGGIGHTEYRSCTTSAGATLCTGNWRPVSPVQGGIRIDYRR